MTATIETTISETDRLRALSDLRAALAKTDEPRAAFADLCVIAGRPASKTFRYSSPAARAA
jgi:hypothetical protein